MGSMKWFTIDGIRTEIERIRWPHGKEFVESISDVLVFTIAFGAFFSLCDLVIAQLIKVIGA